MTIPLIAGLLNWVSFAVVGLFWWILASTTGSLLLTIYCSRSPLVDIGPTIRGSSLPAGLRPLYLVGLFVWIYNWVSFTVVGLF